MYCGSNKTALSSQQQIADAFLRLLRKQSYESISVSAVCREAGISRQTFYSLFESKDNLVVYELGQIHGFTPGSTCAAGGEMTLEELCHEYSIYIMEKREFLKMLSDNGIFYRMHDCLYQSLMECCCFLPRVSGAQRAYAAEFVAGGLSGAARVCTEQDSRMSSEELEKTLHALFTGSFFGKKPEKE